MIIIDKDTSDIILTLVNFAILFLNISTLLMSGCNIYYNGKEFRKSNTIRTEIYNNLIAVFCSATIFIIPQLMWIINKSYLDMSFSQAFMWAITHCFMFKVCLTSNKIACLVGEKSCIEQRQALLDVKDKLINQNNHISLNTFKKSL